MNQLKILEKRIHKLNYATSLHRKDNRSPDIQLAKKLAKKIRNNIRETEKE